MRNVNPIASTAATDYYIPTTTNSNGWVTGTTLNWSPAYATATEVAELRGKVEALELIIASLLAGGHGKTSRRRAK